MSLTKLDIRQSITRVLQDQLAAASNIPMDSILASINSELTSPGRLIAASTPSLVVTVGSGTVVNPQTSKNRVLPLIKNTAVSFTGGTITFPSTSGTITVSPGTNASITIGASQFVAVLVQLDSSGNINLVVGSAAGSLGAVVVPGGSTSFLTLGYIIVQSNAGSVIQNVTNAMIYQMPSGGGGSGSGSGTGDDLDALQYKSSFTDLFSDAPTLTTLSSIDLTAGHTNAVYSATNSAFVISYDASKTVTGTGTSMTLSGTPSFTVVAGDILRVGTDARKIVTVNTQTSYVLESAFSVDPSGAAATVSQAVYTKDINNFAADGISLFSIYGDSISEALVTYNDTTSGTLYNNTDPANVAYTASPDGTTYSVVNSREAALATAQNPVFFTTTGSNLYIRFFSAKSSGSGTVNLVGYKAFFHRDTLTESGNILNQAICRTNGTGTPVGCSQPQVVGGKTQVTLNFSYPVGVNSGSANGSLLVLVDGKKLPRFINSTLTPDGSYTEVSANTIALDTDYSGFNYEIEIYQFVSVVDSNTQNTTNITNLQQSQQRNSLINGNFDFWQRIGSNGGSTSLTVANGVSSYFADRWYVKNSLGTNGVITYSQNAPGLTNSKFGAKIQITTAPTAAQVNGTEFYQTLENEDSLIYLNNTASFQCQIKALGNVTSVGLQFFYATSEVKVTTALGSEQSVTVNTSTFTLGQLVAQSVGTLPTASGVVGVRIRILGVSSGNTYDLNNGFIVEQAMMNTGSACLPYFQRAHVTTSAEFDACQRFCQVVAPTQNAFIGYGTMGSTTAISGSIRLNKQMRVPPTATNSAAGTWVVNRAGSNNAAFSVVTLGLASAWSVKLEDANDTGSPSTIATPGTANAGVFFGPSASGWFQADAEI